MLWLQRRQVSSAVRGGCGLLPAFRIHHDGGGQREAGMDVGESGPGSGTLPAVFVAEVFACIRREFLRAPEVFLCSQWCSTRLDILYAATNTHDYPANWLQT